MTKQEIDAKIAELQELRETAPDELKPYEYSGVERVIHCDGDISHGAGFIPEALFQNADPEKLKPIQSQLKLWSLIYRLKLSLGDTTGLPDDRSVSFMPVYRADTKKWVVTHSVNMVYFGEYLTRENCKKVVEYLNKNCPNWRVE